MTPKAPPCTSDCGEDVCHPTCPRAASGVCIPRWGSCELISGHAGPETTYPIGHRSGRSAAELLALRERCTLRFNHGPLPNPYELPGIDSADPEMAKAAREFLFAVHAALPDLLRPRS